MCTPGCHLGSPMATQPRYMTDCERRLATQWHREDKVSVEEICRRLRRSKASIWEHLGAENPYDRGVGRKPKLITSIEVCT